MKERIVTMPVSPYERFVALYDEAALLRAEFARALRDYHAARLPQHNGIAEMLRLTKAMRRTTAEMHRIAQRYEPMKYTKEAPPR